MSDLIEEIVFTIIFIIGMVANCVTGPTWLAAFSGVMVGLGIGNCLLAYFNYVDAKSKKSKTK